MESGSVIQRNSSSDRGLENDAFEMDEQQDSIIENVTPETRKISSTTYGNKSQGNGPTVLSNDSLRRKRKKVSLNIPEDTPTDSTPVTATNKKQFEDLHHDPNDVNIFARLINGVRLSIYNLVVKNKVIFKYLAIATAFVLYMSYFITALAYNRRNNIQWEWCDGHGMLIILTVLVYWGLFYFHVLKPYYGRRIYLAMIKPVIDMGSRIFSGWYTRTIAILAVIAGIIAFIVVDAWNSPKRLISASGVVLMMLIALLFSKHPGRIMWRQVLGGMGLQFVLGLMALRWNSGRDFLDCVSSKVATFLSFSKDGSNFIYDYLSSGNMTAKIDITSPISEAKFVEGTIAVTALFAFQSLSVIYFFSFVVGILYHIGAMTWLVMKVGWVLQIALGTTAAESMNASANIFLGQTESPILIKPFLKDMTKSEIHAVMTGGFATIAGTVMAAYIGFGVNPSSLLTASVMAAPAALSFSKLVYPETQVSKTTARDIKNMKLKSDGNILDAAAQGASQGFVLVGSIIANIIAVVSFVAFLNALISWFGFLVGQEQLSFEWLLGKIFVPFTICLGVDTEDVEEVSVLLGLKTVVNEFVAYQRLVELGDSITQRSKRIAEFALCSFANFSSVGIQLAGLCTLTPERRLDFSKLIWSALLAGTLTSLLNACVAGALLNI